MPLCCRRNAPENVYFNQTAERAKIITQHVSVQTILLHFSGYFLNTF